MTKQIKIALTGKMRSGKDTVATAFKNNLLMKNNIVSQNYAFGDPLKRLARKLFPNEFKDGNKPRELIQWLGQTMRERDENVWINQLDKEIKSDSWSDLVSIIITDLRQPNEYEYCKNNGYYIIKVECDDAVRIKRMEELNDNFNIADLTHETEGHVDTFTPDYTVNTTYVKTAKELEVLVIEDIINNILKRNK